MQQLHARKWAGETALLNNKLRACPGEADYPSVIVPGLTVLHHAYPCLVCLLALQCLTTQQQVSSSIGSSAGRAHMLPNSQSPLLAAVAVVAKAVAAHHCTAGP
jgi:hypothetical protein